MNARRLIVFALCVAGCRQGATQGVLRPFDVPIVDREVATVQVTPDAAAADGTQRATITVAVVDTLGRPMAGQSVLVAASGSGNTLEQAGLTDAAGRATATLRSTVAEPKVISAAIGEAHLACTQQATVTFLAGAPARLVFAVQPSSAMSGSALAPAVAVAVEDAAGNRSAATPLVTLAFADNANGAVLLGATSAVAVNGVATFEALAIDKAGEGYTLQASAPDLAGAVSAPFAITTGPPARLAFRAQPAAVTVAGVALAPVTVALDDSAGNLLPGGDSVTLALVDPHATLAGTTTVAAVGGVATFSNLVVTHVGAGYTLVATASGYAGATSEPFAIAPAAAARLLMTVQPTDASAGTPIAPAVVVRAVDAFGNDVPTATHTIAAALTNAPGATLAGNVAVSAIGGAATFSNLAVARAGTGYRLAFSATGLAGVISSAFAVVASAPAALHFRTQPSDAVAATAIAPAVAVELVDVFGNPSAAATDSVTVALSGSDPLGGTLTVAAVAGVATFGDLSVDTVGTRQLVATSGALVVTSNPLTIRGGPAARLVLQSQPADATAGTTVSAIAVAVYDAHGNLAASATDAVTVALHTNPGGATLAGTLTVPAVAGVATFSNLWLDKAGTGYTLSLSAPGLIGADSTAFAITPGLPAQLAFTSQPPASVVAGQPYSVDVTVKDAWGNLVVAPTLLGLTLGNNPGGGSLSAPLAWTSNGVATFAGVSLARSGVGYTLSVAWGTLTPVSSAPFDVVPDAPAQIAFVSAIPDTVAGQAIPIQVQILDQFGNFVPTATDTITLVLDGGPSWRSFSSGTLSVPAVAGIATFTDVKINAVGGYQLAAHDDQVDSWNWSTWFGIQPAAPSQLAFLSQPWIVAAGGPIPRVDVAVEDVYGNFVSGASDNMTLALGVNPAGGTLGGTLTSAEVGGVASFGDLSVDLPGSGYTLVANDPVRGLTAESAPFDVN